MNENRTLKEIASAPEGDAARDHVETALGLSSGVEVAGKLLPPPAAAVFAMLELIHSPFLGAEEDEDLSDLAVFQALYVLCERERAMAAVLQWHRREEAYNRLKNELGETLSPESLLVLGNMLNSIADAKARFDLAALDFCQNHFGAFNISDAASEIGFYLSLSGGFEMLPDGDGSKKNNPTTLNP